MNKRKVRITNTGYLPNSPDRYNPMNIIPSNQITMNTVPFPILGIDNLGNQQMMMPGMNYTFPGQYVTEIPMGRYNSEKRYNQLREKQNNSQKVKDQYLRNKMPNYDPTTFFNPHVPLDVTKNLGLHPNEINELEKLYTQGYRTPEELSAVMMFNKGGLVKYQPGGQRKAVYTDPKKYQAALDLYNDQLILYKAYLFQKANAAAGYEQWLNETGKTYPGGVNALRRARQRNVPIGTEYFDRLSKQSHFSNNNDSRYDRLQPAEQPIVDYYRSLIGNNRNFRIGMHNSPDLWHRTINPIGSYIDGAYSPMYAEPIMPVLEEELTYIEPKPLTKLPVPTPQLIPIDYSSFKTSKPRTLDAQSLDQTTQRTGQYNKGTYYYNEDLKKWQYRPLGEEEINYNKEKGKIQKKQGGLVQYQNKGQVKKPTTEREIIEFMADKILSYENLQGGPGGTPLTYYKTNPIYRSMLLDDIYPAVKNIMPNASPIELGEAMDFVLNSGWDKENKTITKDPRVYAIQEYYRDKDPSQLTDTYWPNEKSWPGRNNSSLNYTDLYNKTVAKLSENERRQLMNRGRDWYYRHTAPKNDPWDLKTKGYHPNYENTWYGRIWNTNDLEPFNPNNPKFKYPNKKYKQQGGLVKYQGNKESNQVDSYVIDKTNYKPPIEESAWYKYINDPNNSWEARQTIHWNPESVSIENTQNGIDQMIAWDYIQEWKRLGKAGTKGMNFDNWYETQKKTDTYKQKLENYLNTYEPLLESFYTSYNNLSPEEAKLKAAEVRKPWLTAAERTKPDPYHQNYGRRKSADEEDTMAQSANMGAYPYSINWELKARRKLLMTPHDLKRPSEPIYASNYGQHKGQVQIGETIWDDWTKTWKRKMFTKEEIDNLLKQGAIKKQKGGLVKYQKKGQVDPNTNPNQDLTYKDNPEWFDNRAIYSGNDRYDAQIRKLVYEGKASYNPATKVLTFLKPSQQSKVDQTTKTLSKDKRTWNEEDKNIVAKVKQDATKMTPEKARQYIVDNQKDFVKKSALATGALAVPFGVPTIMGALEAPMVVAGYTVPGVTVGSTIGAGFGGYGITKLPNTYNVVNKAYNNPTTSNITDAAEAVGLNALDFVGLGIGKTAISGANNLKKYLAIESPMISKTLPNSVNTGSITNTAKNLEELTELQKFAKTYGYDFPSNLGRIAQSDELTSRTFRGLIDRHNTFARGISTNWDEIEKINPEILRHLEGKGFNLSTEEGTKAAAEYMATHVPIRTGYGRVGLGNEVFARGMQGLYTSNSLPTAEGYTYGNGFIFKVKRPTNFSSSNRLDWIKHNNPEYYDESLPKLGLPKKYDAKQLRETTIEDLDKALKSGRIDQETHSGLVYYKTEGEKEIRQALRKKYNFKVGEDIPDEYIDDYMDDLYIMRDKKLKELFPTKGYDRKILRTERPTLPVDAYDFLIKKNDGSLEKMREYLKARPYQGKMREANDLGESLSKYTWEEQQPIRDRIKVLEKEAKEMYNQDIQNYMKANHPDYEPINRYAHYIHLGTPGEKVLEPIKSWRITPEIWANKSRGHRNTYTKKFSAMQTGGPTKSQNGIYLGKYMFKNGGLVKAQDGIELDPLVIQPEESLWDKFVTSYFNPFNWGEDDYANNEGITSLEDARQKHADLVTGGFDDDRDFMFDNKRHTLTIFDETESQNRRREKREDEEAQKKLNEAALETKVKQMISIKDPRKVRLTSGKPINPNVDLLTKDYDADVLNEILKIAKEQGLSKEDALNIAAIGFQETGWGATDPNIGHVINPKNWSDDPINQMITAYLDSKETADRLKFTDPDLRLQVYNGLGVVKPETEQDYHGFKMNKIYGVPVPAKGLSMKEHKLYGKQIRDVRDNVLLQNPAFMDILSTYYPSKKKGGVVKAQKGLELSQPIDRIPKSWKEKYDWTDNVENEYIKFKNDPNAPDNLRFTDDLNDYNVRGMWDSLDRPSNWEQALALYKDLNGEEWIPEEDGYYHAWSQHPGTGEWLKPKHHSTAWMNFAGYPMDPYSRVVVNPEGFFGTETLQTEYKQKGGPVRKVKIKTLPRKNQ